MKLTLEDKKRVPIYYIQDDLPLNFVQIHFRGGSFYEFKPGLSHIFSKILLKGPSDTPTDEFYDAVESEGGDLEVDVGYHTLSLKVTIPEYKGRILDTIFKILEKTQLDKETLDCAKEETLVEIREDMEDWQEEAIQYLRIAIFGEHPYGRIIYGKPEDIKKIQLEDLFQWKKFLMNPKNVVIAGAGSEPIGKFLEIIKDKIEVFRDGEPIPSPSPPSPLTGIKKSVKKWKRNESVVLVGFRGASFNSPDRVSLDVLSGFLGGTILPGGWLHTELRDKGLAYFSHSIHCPGEVSGYFALLAATRNSNVERLESVMMEIIDKVKRWEFEKDDIERGIEGALLAISLRNAHIPTKLEETSKYIVLGLGDEYDENLEKSLMNINVIKIQRTIERYLKSMRVIILNP